PEPAAAQIPGATAGRGGRSRFGFALAAQAFDFAQHDIDSLALNELHRVVGQAASRADAEDWHNVTVVQPRRRLCLALEALQEHRPDQARIGQNLQGYMPA